MFVHSPYDLFSNSANRLIIIDSLRNELIINKVTNDTMDTCKNKYISEQIVDENIGQWHESSAAFIIFL